MALEFMNNLDKLLHIHQGSKAPLGTKVDCLVEESSLIVSRRWFIHIKRDAKKIKIESSSSQVTRQNSLNSNVVSSSAGVAGLNLPPLSK